MRMNSKRRGSWVCLHDIGFRPLLRRGLCVPHGGSADPTPQGVVSTDAASSAAASSRRSRSDSAEKRSSSADPPPPPPPG